MLLSIIIVNYNVKAFLEQCLFSVAASINAAAWHAGKEVEVLVVDNHSSDNSRAHLEPAFPWVHFVWKQNNPGFGKANNEALLLAKGEFVLFLNPDTILQENTLGSLTQWMQQHNDAGATGVYMIDGRGQYLPESKRGFPSPAASFYKLSGLIKLFPRHKKISAYYMGHLHPKENNRVDVLSGACMMVRKKILDSIGGFDERFFMYAEDIDLSYRIQQAGYHNYCIANTAIIHFKGESTASASLVYVKLFYKAMQQFVEKHYAGAGMWAFRLLLTAAIWSRGAFAFCTGWMRSDKWKNSPVLPGRWAVIGNAAAIDTILSNNKLTPQCVDPFPDMNALLQQKWRQYDAVVLSYPTMLYQNIVHTIEEYGASNLFMVHCHQSNSIAGSGSKTNKGLSYSG